LTKKNHSATIHPPFTQHFFQPPAFLPPFGAVLQGYLAAGRMTDARDLVQQMSSRGLSANKAPSVDGMVANFDEFTRWL